MANRFFYDKVYNLTRIVLNITLIISLIALIIISFSVVSDKKLNDPRENYGIKNSLTVPIGTDVEKRMFFDFEKSDFSELAEVIYPNSYDKNKKGKYEIIININNQQFISYLIVENSN